MTNFDIIIERKGSGALKTDALAERFGRDDLIALWVADMDFATPDFILESLRQRLEHPVLGYTIEPEDYRPSIIDWLKDLHGAHVRPEWISYIPGIVKGIGLAIHCFVMPDEAVIIQPPVYHPFRLVPEAIGRKVLFNSLIETSEGKYEMDLAGLEEIASSPKARMLIMSSPHNPAGIAWDKETLEKVADICKRNNVIVISDEIHSEMMLWGKRHTPFYEVSQSARDCSITFAAPTKTFNIAGVVSSYSIVPDYALRKRFYDFLKGCELDEPTIFAPIATIACYRKGRQWRQEMLAYVEDNIRFVEDFCQKNLPGIVPVRPDASFLVWLDCRGLNMPHEQIVALFKDKAHLALNDGAMFGNEGICHMRLNVGTPRAILQKALTQLEIAIKETK